MIQRPEDFDPLEVGMPEVAEAWQDIAGTDAGRIVLAWLAHNFAYDFRTTMTRDMNPIGLAFQEGQRSVVGSINKMLTADAEKIRQQQAERGEMDG